MNWNRNLIKKLLLMSFLLLLSACTLGPDYVPPCISVPDKFKEAPKGWKVANPNDACDRGEWWKIFNNLTLNKLEKKLSVSNQNIKLAIAQYEQSRALVTQAYAAFFRSSEV